PVEIAPFHVAAGQRRRRGPGLSAWLQISRKFLHGILGQAPVGRYLAAENRKERRLPRRCVEIENVIARRGGRIFRVVVIERPHPGKTLDHIARAKRLAEITRHGGAKIRDFLSIYPSRQRISRKRDLGRANE